MNTKYLRRAAALGSVSLVALAQPAMAATATSPRIVNYVDQGGACVVVGFAEVTGTTDDTGAGTDRIYGGVTAGTGTTALDGGQQRFATVGTTQTLGARAFIRPSTAPSGTALPLYWNMIDYDPAGNPSGSFAQVPIDINQMRAAGGLCAQVANQVSPTNNPPVADAGSDSFVFGNTQTTLDATASTDSDGTIASYAWTQISGPAVSLSNANSAQATFTAPPTRVQAQTMEFRVTVTDNDGATSTDTVQITVRANLSPNADAGQARTINAGDTVALDASASRDIDGSIVSYTWRQVNGPSVSISNTNSAQASFTAPASMATQQSLLFEVRVEDDLGATDVARVSFTLAAAANQTPVADAGSDQTVSVGDTVALTAAGSSDPDGDPLTYQWIQVGGRSQVSLTGATTQNASYVQSGPPGVYVFDVTVTDPSGASSTDRVSVTAQGILVPINQPPVADAGNDRTVPANTQTILDATASTDSDGTIVSYQWVQISGVGQPTPITNANSARASITTPAAISTAQVLVYEVRIADDDGATSSDRVTITVPANAAPDAVTGPDRTINPGDPVTLDATGSSDPDGTIASYVWTQVNGPNVTLSNANSAQATFTAPAATASQQVLVFEVTVTDNAGATDTETVTLTIAANQAPTADAGADRRVDGGEQVTLDASNSSDPEGDKLTYSWTQTGGSSVTLSNAGTATPSFTAPLGTATDQDLTFEVTVSDGISSVTDTVVITVDPNFAPVADAGVDQGPIDEGQTITLDGSGSSDPDGDTLTYTWTQTGGENVTLSNPNAISPTFTAPAITGTQVLTFELVVNDGQVDSAPDTVQVTVQALGTITIVQRVVGPDVRVDYTSNVPGLAGSATTSNGTAIVSATNVTSGAYTFSVDDLRAQGYALTALSCNDADSTVNFGNASIALQLSPSENLVCTVELSDTRGAAQQAIGEFLGGRNALLLAGQPDISRRINRLRGTPAGGGSASFGGIPVPGSGKLPMDLRMAGGQVRMSSSLAMAKGALGIADNGDGRFDIWFEGQLSDVTIGRNKGTFAVGFLGADYLVSENLLVGALVQYDRFDNEAGTLAAGMAEGDGWMAGPYVTARFGERFFVDARVAYGQSDNSVSPLGTNVDGFDTERLFADFAATGEVPLGNGVSFWPEAGLRYLREDVQSYTDSGGVVIPDFRVDQGEASLRPRIAYNTMLESGWHLAPYGEFEGILTFGADAFSPVEDGVRGRVAAGLEATSPQGIRIGVGGFFDGIGEDGLEQVGGRISVSFGF